MKTVITACSIFFRSKAYRYVALLGAWQHFVVSQDKSVKVSERAVLLGDHTSVVKDGRKMPGVVSMHEESETQSKPSYFRGQCWGSWLALYQPVFAVRYNYKSIRASLIWV
jgi:hypothetical protein